MSAASRPHRRRHRLRQRHPLADQLHSSQRRCRTHVRRLDHLAEGGQQRSQPTADLSATIPSGTAISSSALKRITAGRFRRPRRLGADSMTRLFNDDAQAPATHHYFYTAPSAAAPARKSRILPLRARAGFVMDRFLPYAFAGAAVGRVDIVRSATVSYTRQRYSRQSDAADAPITPEAGLQLRPGNPEREQERRVRLRIYRGARHRRARAAECVPARRVGIRAVLPGAGFQNPLDTGRVGVGIKF